MAKNRGDVILRDRMQFDLDGSGDRTTLYGRIDLSAYVNPVARDGLAIKEVRFQLRQPTNGNTGFFKPVADFQSSGGSVGSQAAIKLYATTRAYENAADVGIASPDVLCVYEALSSVVVTPAGVSPNFITTERFYGPKDLHPEGFTVVSDLLIGVAADFWSEEQGATLELDIMLIAEPISVTTERMNELLAQGMDL